MTLTHLSPEGLQPHTPYHHVSIATGSRHVHIAGQIAVDAEGRQVAPGDLAGQVARVLHNTATALSGANASFSDVVRMTFFVTDWAPEKISAFMAGIESVAEEVGLPRPLPPASLIGVDCLFEPDVLVELETTAITD